ncbi:MAG TPA: flagellar basal-body MS-ring/collar protein FliF [Terriglobales bacterium]|nr:flagellar basal-body MS-ring/collar protein FliF [Terriglobales bacterium]
MPTLTEVQKQVTDFAKGLSVKQGGLLIGASVLTIAVLVVFVHLIATPDYKPLVTGMEAADAKVLGSKLAAKNIPYVISDDGKTVSVPSDKVDASRMEVAADGMPPSGRMGFEMFDKLNWGQTEFDEKVNYQRALEAELERSIETLRDVDSVRVHLVLPTSSVFIDRERKAKASVVLKLKSKYLSEDTHMAIARLVAGAVDELSPDNVTVIDATTNRPLGPATRDALSPNGDLEKQLSSQLLETLEPVVGAQHVRARVNVEYDPTSSEENDESYDPKSVVAVAEQHSEERVGGMLNGGVVGTSSNVPGGNPPAKPGVDSGGDGSQLSKSESSTFAVNKIVRHMLQPAGRIRRISAAVVVDDAVEVKEQNGKREEVRHKRTAAEMRQITDLAKASIGVDPARGDVLMVQNLSFEQSPVETPAKPTTMDKVRVTLADWSSLLRYAALIVLFLLAYQLLLRPLKNQLITTLRELPAIASKRGSVGGVDLALGQDLADLPPDQQRSIALKRQLLQKVTAEPVATSKLIQAWIREEAK